MNDNILTYSTVVGYSVRHAGFTPADHAQLVGTTHSVLQPIPDFPLNGPKLNGNEYSIGVGIIFVLLGISIFQFLVLRQLALGDRR